NPTVVGTSVTKVDVASLGVDPGPEVDEAWWEEMLVAWFEEPEPAQPEGEPAEPVGEKAESPAEQDTKKAEA
ncbi:MAG: hypothetical protein ACREI9_08565, partial [Nitrospiraceae bacterium]